MIGNIELELQKQKSVASEYASQLTKREHFALEFAKLIGDKNCNSRVSTIAQSAVCMADELIKELNK